MGSSPLARGLLQNINVISVPNRIIPARAGFTAGVNELLCGRQDHPRSRGVYDAKAGSFLLAGGSSPLARGLPARALVEKFGHRIIPARAGFTREHSGHVQDRWGSSPLARGLHAPVDEGVRVRGIIPARAGFTRRLVMIT